MMNIPAYTSPTLILGRTFDRETLSVRADISSTSDDIPTSKEEIDKFSFKYQVVTNSQDVSDLLGISGELSLQIKANLRKAEGVGQYVRENKIHKRRTNLLAVMKCTTVVEKIAGSLKVRDDVSRDEVLHSLGTHYVSSVTYGFEIVASLTCNSSSESPRDQIKGSATGKLGVRGAADVGLKAALDKLSKECKDVSNISIRCYATDLPDSPPTTVDGLVALIENFPYRLMGINAGKGIPVLFELQSVNSVIPKAKAYIQQQVFACDIQELESCFDDLRNTHALAKAYLDKREDDVVKRFYSDVNKLQRKFRDAIKKMNSLNGPDRIQECIEAYRKALGGLDIEDKFADKLEEILKTKATIKLPPGNPLTVVLFGKTGNGKSATGNSILGRDHFIDSPSGSSVTKKCDAFKRKEEREVTVIDTPGIMDTASVSAMEKAKEKVRFWTGFYDENQKSILRELAKVFVMSPYGLDAIIITIKYGGRFGPEDAEALRIFKRFFGIEALPYMILILTHGDEAAFEARKLKRSIEEQLESYINSLPVWVQQFVKAIGERRMLFNNRLDPQINPDDCTKQVSKLLQIIDEVRKQRGPLIHHLTSVSREVLNEEIKKALDEKGITKQEDDFRRETKEIRCQLRDPKKSHEEKRELEKRLVKIENIMAELNDTKAKVREGEEETQFNDGLHSKGGKPTETVYNESMFGGCYPGSAFIYDSNSQARRMESLQVGDKVLVITKNGIQSDPVITFIHRQPEIVEKFLKIVTKKEKILLITADHLLFMEVIGQPTAIPARDVKIGDTVYVRGSHGSEKDLVQSISTVYEKGAYAPVTLSGTILVNDVHTSCYFDVLSHEWSHRAMSIARTLHYVSPSMVRRISAVGEKDGFPGWCRLAHTMLTLLD